MTTGKQSKRAVFLLPFAAVLAAGAVFCAGIFLPVPFAAAQGTGPANSVGPGKAAPTRLYGRVDALSGAMHGAGLTIESLTLPTPVLAVRGGSPAYWAGVKVGDKLTKMEMQGDILQVNIVRNGQTFAANLRTAPPSADESQQPVTGSSVGFGTGVPRADSAGLRMDDRARFALKTSEWRTLAAYDIVLMVDRSGSMEDLVDELNMSRWQWVQRLVDDFAREADRFAAKTFDLVIFNDKYSLEHNVSAARLPAIFHNYQPAGGTRLYEPLAASLNEHFQRAPNRPLLIAVLTDGEPEAYEEIGQLIAAATRQVHSVRELHITFLGVGENEMGTGVFRYFDDSLTSKGAVYDVVDTISFEELRRVGLATALTRSFARVAQTR